MKKIKIQKDLLKYVSDDDMAFIEAYNLLKTPKAPVKSKFVFVDTNTLVTGSASISKEMLIDWIKLIDSGHTISQFVSGYHPGVRSSKKVNNIAEYEKANTEYDKLLTEYLSSYESLHPIVVSLMNAAKEKQESEMNGYDKLPDDIDELKEIIKKNKIKL